MSIRRESETDGLPLLVDDVLKGVAFGKDHHGVGVDGVVVEDDDSKGDFFTANDRIRKLERNEERLGNDQLGRLARHAQTLNRFID